MGGDPCVGFADCCSGTCAGNVCTQCATTGDKCGQGGCCIGDTCYFGVCHNCKDDGNPCQTSGDCCSTVCSQGTCAPLDCGSLLSCGSYCVDSANDANNCGSCGNVCPVGATCCGGKCRDTLIDPAHCGACYSPCDQQHYCDNGSCAFKPECCEASTNYGIGNPAAPVLTGNGTDGIKWDFTPTCSFLLTAVKIFTDAGAVWLEKGGVGLGSKWLDELPSPQWQTWTLAAPVQLVSGQTYQVGQQFGGGMIVTVRTSEVVGGVPIPSKIHKSNAWTNNPNLRPLSAIFVGNCPP
jgi:hypothetical protein